MTDSNSSIGAWLRAANPLAASADQAQALRAARIGAVSAALMAIQSVVGGVITFLHPERMLMAMQASMEASYRQKHLDPATADTMINGMIEWMPGAMLTVAVIFAIIELILALVQWRRPNVIIPAILLALVAFGLLSGLRARLTQPQLAAAVSSPGMLAYTLVSNIIHIVLLVAAIRGALALGRMRRGAV